MGPLLLAEVVEIFRVSSSAERGRMAHARKAPLFCLLLSLAVINLGLVGVAVYIWRVKEWHSPMLRLLSRCKEIFLILEGSSSNGFISGLLVAILEILAVLLTSLASSMELLP
jgi:hypothetical protein